MVPQKKPVRKLEASPETSIGQQAGKRLIPDDPLSAKGARDVTDLTRQAIDVRQQMEQIRCDLAEEVSHVASDARQLVDYRYYFRQHPWWSLAAAATVGYLLVPRRERKISPRQAALNAVVENKPLVFETNATGNRRRGLLATGVSLMATVATRAAVNYAQREASERLAGFLHTRQASATASAGHRPAQPR